MGPSALHARRLNATVGLRESSLLTILEDHRLVFLGHALVHHRAVPVSLYMGLEALQGSAPLHLAHLATGQRPLLEAIEGLPQGVHRLSVHQVHEGIAQVGVPSEVAGQVDEVIPASNERLQEAS